MENAVRKTTFVLGALLVLAASGTTAARSQEVAGARPPENRPPTIAEVAITPSRLDWTPILGAENDPILLTIAGPQGFYLEKRFPHGTPSALDLGEVREGSLPDGAYSYELRTMGKGAGRAQSGFFSVHDGKIVVPATRADSVGHASARINSPEPPLQLKQIIQEGVCIGAQCGTGDEGSPLRLKDSYLRLDFTDTFDNLTDDSDWAIETNGIGSAGYFAIVDMNGFILYPFRVMAGAPSDSLFITSSGNVGIGTAVPAVQLDTKVGSSNSAVARLQNTSSSGYSAIEYLDQSGNVDLMFGIDNANSTTRLNSINNNPIVILTNSTERIRFPAPGGNFITAANGAILTSGGVWQDVSSRESKRDIAELDGREALAAFKKLDPVKFQYKAEPGEQYVGFIAEDVPELVATNDRKHLNSMDVVAVLTKVVQEQQKTIEALNARLLAVENRP